MCWVRKKMEPNRLNMARASAPLAAAKRASANSRRSSIGCFERNSQVANAASATADSPNAASVDPAVHPASGASMIA
jgi:hypothetical protein